MNTRTAILMLGLLALASVATAATKKAAAQKPAQTQADDDFDCGNQKVYVVLGAPKGEPVYRAANSGKGLEITITSSKLGEDKIYYTYIANTTLPVRTGVVVNNNGDAAVVFTENGNASPIVMGRSDEVGVALFNYLDLTRTEVANSASTESGFHYVWVKLKTNWKKGLTTPTEERAAYSRFRLTPMEEGEDAYLRPVQAYPWQVSDLLVSTINVNETTSRVAACASGIRFGMIDINDIPDAPSAKR